LRSRSHVAAFKKRYREGLAGLRHDVPSARGLTCNLQSCPGAFFFSSEATGRFRLTAADFPHPPSPRSPSWLPAPQCHSACLLKAVHFHQPACKLRGGEEREDLKLRPCALGHGRFLRHPLGMTVRHGDLGVGPRRPASGILHVPVIEPWIWADKPEAPSNGKTDGRNQAAGSYGWLPHFGRGMR